MKVSTLGTHYAAQIEIIRDLASRESLWAAEAMDILLRAQKDHAATDDLLQTLHTLSRLAAIAAAGLENNATFHAALAAENLPTWKDYGQPPVSLELQHSLAAKLYNVKPGDFAVINLDDGARAVGLWLVDRCLKDNIPFTVNFGDSNFNALIINHVGEDEVKAMAARTVERMKPVTKIMTARSGMKEKEIAADPAKSKLYSLGTKPYSDRIRSGDIFYTLTEIPTRKDAQIDDIPYDDYLKLFFEMCDQPWDDISTAQKALIAEFNATTTVRITNNDGTDISMELVDHDGTHFTFCNSLIAKNVPGSEIFSAPRRDSVNGKIVAKGRFEHDREIIEDLTLEFVNGRLASWNAAKNGAAFENALRDEGARWVGELGIGTNPHLKQHVANGLLVEKIGGSFHLALGACYAFTSYAGVPVKVDNGNQSALHWDITTMLYGKGGRIYLDGRMIMDDGKFLDRKYDVLNRGWAAIPADKRPSYWKNHGEAA